MAVDNGPPYDFGGRLTSNQEAILLAFDALVDAASAAEQVDAAIKAAKQASRE